MRPYDEKSRSVIFREQIRIAGFAILAFGVMLTIASLFADPLALGMPGSSFGWKQILGTLLGLLISAAGGYVLHRTAQADAADAKANANEGEDDNA